MQTFVDSLVPLANFGQALVPLLSLFAYLPQWRKLLVGKSSGSISASSWALWTLTSFLALFYAVVQLHVTGFGWALVFSAALGLLFVLVTLLLVLRYRVSKVATTTSQLQPAGA
jgi:uncharacterized protein with PQ loop repeat